MANPPLGPNARQWRIFTALLVTIYCLRGVVLACVIPPLEMWDEYQHVAYIDFLSATHRMPIISQSQIPSELIRAVIQFPQGNSAQRQLAGDGAVGYQQYWQQARPIPLSVEASPISIYEAQHPPIYYWLMGPIYRAAGGAGDLGAAVCALRLVNVGISAVGIAWFLRWLSRECRQVSQAMLIGAAIALHPLFLLNACRVANDALAVTLGIAVIVWIFNLNGRRLIWQAAGIGALVGVAVMTKATDIILIPFGVLVILHLCISGKTTWRLGAVALALMIAVFAIVTVPYFRFTYAHYRMLIPTGEAIVNRTNHVPLQNYIRWLGPGKWGYWLGCIHRWFTWEGIWVGGWSFLKLTPVFPRLFDVLTCAAAIGWIFVRTLVFRNSKTAVMIVLLCLCMIGGMLAHGVISAQLYNMSSAEPWYASLVIPWFIALVSAGLINLRGALAICLPLLFLLTELHGVWQTMIPFYSQEKLSSSALHRLASLRPAALGTPTLFTAFTLMLITMAIGFVTIAKSGDHDGKKYA